MPTIDEAIERAARAVSLEWTLSEDNWQYYTTTAKAALSAFLADVPVSEGMVDAGRKANTFALPVCYKTMCAKLAKEIQ